MKLRQVSSNDQKLLREMLYLALWNPPEEGPRPRSVLDDPGIAKLVGEWGRPDDFGLIAMDSGEEVGGIWARLDGYDGIDGYGCDYPMIGIAVLERFRGRGVGSILMKEFIDAVRPRVPGLRLGVHPKNAAAIGLYEKMGFVEYAIGKGDYPQMKLCFGKD